MDKKKIMRAFTFNMQHVLQADIRGVWSESTAVAVQTVVHLENMNTYEHSLIQSPGKHAHMYEYSLIQSLPSLAHAR